jgi:hypothetical protein
MLCDLLHPAHSSCQILETLGRRRLMGIHFRPTCPWCPAKPPVGSVGCAGSSGPWRMSATRRRRDRGVTGEPAMNSLFGATFDASKGALAQLGPKQPEEVPTPAGAVSR